MRHTLFNKLRLYILNSDPSLLQDILVKSVLTGLCNEVISEMQLELYSIMLDDLLKDIKSYHG